jgi:hypothetical protein
MDRWFATPPQLTGYLGLPVGGILRALLIRVLKHDEWVEIDATAMNPVGSIHLGSR